MIGRCGHVGFPLRMMLYEIRPTRRSLFKQPMLTSYLFFNATGPKIGSVFIEEKKPKTDTINNPLCLRSFIKYSRHHPAAGVEHPRHRQVLNGNRVMYSMKPATFMAPVTIATGSILMLRLTH